VERCHRSPSAAGSVPERTFRGVDPTRPRLGAHTDPSGDWRTTSPRRLTPQGASRSHSVIRHRRHGRHPRGRRTLMVEVKAITPRLGAACRRRRRCGSAIRSAAQSVHPLSAGPAAADATPRNREKRPAKPRFRSEQAISLGRGTPGGPSAPTCQAAQTPQCLLSAVALRASRSTRSASPRRWAQRPECQADDVPVQVPRYLLCGSGVARRGARGHHRQPSRSVRTSSAAPSRPIRVRSSWSPTIAGCWRRSRSPAVSRSRTATSPKPVKRGS